MCSIRGDHCNYNSSGVVLYVGGNYNQNQNYGLFYLNGNNGASNSNGNIGCRIHFDYIGLLHSRKCYFSCGAGVAHLLVKILSIKGWLSTPSGAQERSLDKNGELFDMKRVGNLYGQMISDENIREAIEVVNKSHRWRGNHHPNKTVLWVETTIDNRIEELRKIIEDGFEPTEPTVKRRYDRNARKWRDIAEPKLYPDQYVHHIMIQALEPIMMRGMDPFCCGSIKGRGAHYGVKYIKKWMKNDRKGTRWCAELDIYHFYPSLNPTMVMNRFRSLIKDYRVLDLVERVMRYGVMIGGYFSQWFANTFLQPLDVLIRESGVNHYVRYMDNFTIFASNKKTLVRTLKSIKGWLVNHGLRLKDNWQYFKTRKRLPDALGYRYGHTYTLIRKARLLAIKRQVRSYHRQGGTVSAKFAMSMLSRLSGFRHCNASEIYRRVVPKGLQKKLKAIIREHQRKERMEWSTYLKLYAAGKLTSKASKRSERNTPYCAADAL